MSLMGLDVGTTGCKANVFDLEGRLLASAYEEYPLLTPRPGWLELDPEQIWRSVAKVVNQAAADAAGDPVRALAISCLGEAGALLDREGRVLRPSIVCFDNRAQPLFDQWLQDQDPVELMRITGQPPSQMYSLAKLMWVKANEPDLYRRLWKYLCYEEFLIYRMGLPPTTDYSVASRTMAFDVRGEQWSERVCALADISPDLFADAKPSGTIVGELGDAAAKELGLPKDCKVVTGGHDQPCGAVGAGVIAPGVAMDATGTTECIAFAFDHIVADEHMMRHNFCCAHHVAPGLYMTLTFNLTGGNLLKWFRDTLAGEQRLQAEQRGVDVYDILMEEMVEEPTDLFVLPHFAMTGTPYLDADPTGAIVGLKLTTTRGELVKAIVEGITYEMKLNLALVKDAGIRVDELRAIGGAAKSDRWLQIKADMFNTPVVKLSVTEAASLGVALAAGAATGAYASLREAVEQVVKPETVFEPDPRRAAAYDEKLAQYRELYPLFKRWRAAR